MFSKRSARGETRAAKENLERAKMRRALYEMLWQMTHEANGRIPAEPCPDLNDRQIYLRLKDLLGNCP